VFFADRWAEAFVNAAGAFSGASPSPENAEEGLAAFKALLPPVMGLHRAISGAAQAIRLEGMIRTAAAASGIRSPGMEGAIRLITLLVKKNGLPRGGQVAERIEKLLSEKKGRVEVILESAVPPEEEFQEALKQALRKKTGAGEVVILPRTAPELLGGCRLRMGGISIDASLRGQLEKMAADLSAPGIPGAGNSGGN
jgi:F-type H+-transporting ATPase subunit delta